MRPELEGKLLSLYKTLSESKNVYLIHLIPHHQPCHYVLKDLQGWKVV